jgi:iron uptake system component EfeO
VTLIRLLPAAAAALFLAACGSDDDAKPAADGRTVKASYSDAGCRVESTSIPAGATTFEVTNDGATKVTELEIVDADGVVLGEVENLADGESGNVTLNLQSAAYSAKCPGAAQELAPLTVTGEASTATDTHLQAAVDGWKQFVAEQADLLLERTHEFADAVRAGDVEKSKSLFAVTRAPYERIEPVAESFGDLDPAIDARVNDVAKGTEWTGFHRIEHALWEQGTTAGLRPLADRLVRDVEALHARIPKLDFQAAQLANGAVELLNEVAKSKITGEEDRYSHTDLADFQANLEGAQQAFALLRPALGARDKGDLAATIDERFATVSDGLAEYARPGEASGWASYEALTPADRRSLSQAIDALAEPLSTVAAHVAA